MPQFDPSVIADIGASGPDVAGSMAKGFQLKDLLTQTNIDQLRLSTLKKESQEKSDIDSLAASGKYDLSTNKGLTEFSQALTKAGHPGAAMDAMRTGQTIQSGELDNKIKQLQIYEKAIDFSQGLIAPVVMQAQQMRQAGKSDAIVSAYIRSQIPVAFEAIQKSDLPDDLKQQSLQKLAAEQNMGFDQLMAAEANNKQVRAAIKSQLDDLNVKSEISHRAVEEKQRGAQLGIEQEGVGIERERLKLQQGSSQLDAMYAAFGEAGIQIPGRSRQTQDAAMRGLLAEHPDMTPQDIAKGVRNGQISMKVSTTEASVLGRREAAILPVEKSITRPGGFLDQAESAVNSVDFPKLKAAGEFSKWGKEQLSDPSLSRYKAAVAELRAEYSIVLSKGGQVTDAARHEAEKVIPDLITKEQFKAIKQVVLQGIESSKGGIEESLTGVSAGETPGQGGPAAPAATGKVVQWSDLK